jgi:AraC-like DNA-binding protein
MPSSSVRAFADPDAYHAAIRNAEVEGFVTTRGNYRAELTRVDLYRLWMQRSVETLPRVLTVRRSDWRATIFFSTDLEQAPFHIRGMELGRGEIALLGAGSADHQRSSAASRWGVLSLTGEDLAAAGQTIMGRELTSPPLTYRLSPPPAILARLLSLHDAVGHLAKTAPDILAQPEVARALEHGLVHAMVSCIGGGTATETTSAHHRHAVMMRRLEELLEENPDGALYLAEFCAAAGASDRTLRAVCRKHLGMSPMRYLWLRRMHLARRALRMADPATTTVTEIATNYGFWELGRFSVTFRSLFGESPSAALRRPGEEPRPQRNTGSPWRLPESA